MGKQIRIIFLGGLLAVFCYLLWNNFGAYIQEKFMPKSKESKGVVVRDVFKKSYKYTGSKKITKLNSKNLLANKEGLKTTAKENESIAYESFGINPITEEQRQLLIQKAREAIESRLDPFGQEVTLPPGSTSGNKIKKLPPPEVNLVRKQIELVGVVSSKEKDLGLVNVYVADFSVDLDATEEDVEEKMQSAFSMSVPDRIEVYVLDPVEDWYVKTINRSNSRSEDPFIELVQGNKKFILKVGQRVLLPADISFEEAAAIVRAERSDEERIAKELGLF